MTEKKGIFTRLKESIFGTPTVPHVVKETGKAVLGQVEQTIGRYATPSFREQVTTFWNDPLISEAVIMFSEQVMSTGYYLAGNPKYTTRLPIEENGKREELTALEVIQKWCDKNNLRVKLMDICIDLKAFGNSFWRIDKFGFVRIPIEAVWRAVPRSPNTPLQIEYDIQLTPIYNSEIIPYGEFIHFRVHPIGYHAPFGRGIMYGLLAKPVDSEGRVSPSIYDIRLSMRGSLHEGFKKFSFGNELWVFEGMSNEDFEASKIGEKIANMSSTGNRIATNTRGRIELAVPERTQSYDQFIKQMNDEFMMSLADPSLKLGLEKGFTKATAETAQEMYKLKVSNMRRTIKEQLEDLFKQILDKLGFDGEAAGIEIIFGQEEAPKYAVKDLMIAESRGIITKNETRRILSKYVKWDITGDIEGGDIPSQDKPLPIDTRYTVKESVEDTENIEYLKYLKEIIETINQERERLRKRESLVDKKSRLLEEILTSTHTETQEGKIEEEKPIKLDINVNIPPVKSEATVNIPPIQVESKANVDVNVKSEPVKSEVKIESTPQKLELELKEVKDEKLEEEKLKIEKEKLKLEQERLKTLKKLDEKISKKE